MNSGSEPDLVFTYVKTNSGSDPEFPLHLKHARSNRTSLSGMPHACSSGMKRDMSEANSKPAGPDLESIDLEKEIESWNWARAAGVSAQELHKALRESLGRQEPK